MKNPVRVVVPNGPAAPIGQLLDLVVANGVIPPGLADAIRATERHYNARVPDTVSGPPNPWKARQSALIAARASRVLRFNPTLLLAEWLLLHGLENIAEAFRQDAERRRLRGAGPLIVPVPGGFGGEGWSDATAGYVVPDWSSTGIWESLAYGTASEWGYPAALSGPAWPSFATDPGLWAAIASSPITLPFTPADAVTAANAFALGSSYPADPSWQSVVRILNYAKPPAGPGTLDELPAAMLMLAKSPTPRGVPWSLATPRHRTEGSALPTGRQAAYDVALVEPATGRRVEPATGRRVEPATGRRVFPDRGAVATHEGDWAVQTQGRASVPDASSTKYRTSREGKLGMGMMKKVMAVRFLEELLEASDAIGAVYKALPVEVQRAVRQRWVEEQFRKGVKRPAREVPDDVKLAALWEFWRFLDYEGVKRELQWEAFSDATYGVLGQLLAKANTRQIRTTSVSPATVDEYGWERGSHPLDPSIPWGKGQPLESFQDWFTGRSARRSEQAQREDVRAFAIAEAARLRQDRNARMARKRAYRQANGPKRRRTQ